MSEAAVDALLWAQGAAWLTMTGLLVSGSAALLGWMAVRRLRGATGALDRRPTLSFAVGLTAAWGVVILFTGPYHPVAHAFEQLRNLGWLAFLFAVSTDQRAPMRRPEVALFAALALLMALMIVRDAAVIAGMAPATDQRDAPSPVYHGVTMLIAIGGLFAIDTSIRSAGPRLRRPVLIVGSATAALWAYDLNAAAIALFIGRPALSLAIMQPLIAALLLPVVAFAIGDRHDGRMRLSRGMAYRTVALVGLTAYLVAMGAVAVLVHLISQSHALAAQLLFLVFAGVSGGILLRSKRLRAWLRVVVSKHFYEHRLDYREAWASFTARLGRADRAAAPLDERVIDAVAELCGSPAGVLLKPGAGGEFALVSAWHVTDADRAEMLVPGDVATAMFAGGRIVDLDRARLDAATATARLPVPAWLLEWTEAWAVVPLAHAGRLQGVVVLTRPVPARALDWEDFDLLRVCGQQAAGLLAEADAQAALSEARRFDEFNRRFAFIMHDIKNIASQVALLARNAERHADKPDFRADMVATLNGAASRLNDLIARLNRPRASAGADMAAVDLADVAAVAASREALGARIEVAPIDAAVGARGTRSGIEQIVGHLVRNAVEAGGPDSPVTITVSADADTARLSVRDAGPGMSAAFVREQLFKPFVSSKSDGFGLGAFEALALAQSMAGTIEVISQEGQGTVMTLVLPRVDLLDRAA